MAGGEGVRLAGFSGPLVRGGVSAPVDCIHRPVEVPPAGVGLCAMYQTIH